MAVVLGATVALKLVKIPHLETSEAPRTWIGYRALVQSPAAVACDAASLPGMEQEAFGTAMRLGCA